MRWKLVVVVVVSLLGFSYLALAKETACPPCAEVYVNKGDQAQDLEAVIIRTIRAVPNGGTILVMVAWFKMESIAAELLDAVKRRGVEVRVLTSTASDCKWLVGQGIAARRHTGIHHKVAILPDKVLTGSANWTTTSLKNDWNDIVIIYDPTVREVYLLLFDLAWSKVKGCGD